MSIFLKPGGELRFGYRILIVSEEESIKDDFFTEEPFVGGLYAARKIAEQRLIDWYERKSDGNRLAVEGKYYMSYDYGAKDSEDYWWENGILATESEAVTMAGLEQKCMRSGLYACFVSKTYGLLTGVLDRMHQWISTSVDYRLDEERQWFAEYHTFQGTNIERDTIVKVYIPILFRGV